MHLPTLFMQITCPLRNPLIRRNAMPSYLVSQMERQYNCSRTVSPFLLQKNISSYTTKGLTHSIDKKMSHRHTCFYVE